MWPTDNDTKLYEYDAMELPGQQLKAAQARTALDHVLDLNIKAPAACLRLTGIIATIGPSSANLQTLENMIRAGMNVAVINMCFGKREEHIDMIKTIKMAAKNVGTDAGKVCPVAIGICLTGKKIRTGKILDSYAEEIELITGEQVKLTTDETYKERCSTSTVYIDYSKIADQLKKTDVIYIDNEAIKLKVLIISANTVTCRVEDGGLLGSYKDVFVPNVNLDMPNFTDKDKNDLAMAIKHQLDIVIISFVLHKKEVTEMKELLGEKGKKMSILAHIQNYEGYKNLDDILSMVNGIIATRQEFGSDISPNKLVIAQKNIIARANMANIPVCVTANVLASMKYSSKPLRSELLDISNTVLDGADCFMLQSETAVGLHPIETVAVMSKTCKEAESCAWTRQNFIDLVDKTDLPCDQVSGIALAAALAAQRLLASAIIVVTSTGHSAKLVAKYRPRCPIIAITRYIAIAKQLHLYRGILPLVFEDTPDINWHTDVENRISFGIKYGLQRGFLRVGDPIVVVSGWKQGSGYTNTMRIIYTPPETV